MGFWYLFYGIIWIVFTIALFFTENQNKYMFYISIFVVWFIGAFRFNIGTDYYTYVTWYDTWDMYTHGAKEINEIEPGFYYLVNFLNAIGVHYQALFVVYETIILFFLYKGLNYFLSENWLRFAVFAMFVFFPSTGGHWWDMNGIRQAAAISISFLGMKYLVEDKLLKFMLIFLVAMMFHYSSLLIILMILFKRKIIPFKVVFLLLIVGFTSNALGITAGFAMSIIGNMAALIGRYEAAVLAADAGTASFSIVAFFLVVLYYFAKQIMKNEINPLVYNGASIYILLRVYMSFGVEGSILSSVVHRFEAYFLYLYLTFLAMAMGRFVKKQSNKYMAKMCISLMIFCFCILGLYNIYMENVNGAFKIINSPSDANIKYQFNFDLF